MPEPILISGHRLRQRSGWTEIPFVDDADECFVDASTGRVSWTDASGQPRELGALTPAQLEALIATEQAALDAERGTKERPLGATLYEQGNGLPHEGDYASDGDYLYEIVSIDGRIQTDSPRGNYVSATVRRVPWDACPEADQHTARVMLDADADPRP